MTPLQKMAWIEACFWIAATLVFLALLFGVGPGPAPAAFAVIGLLPIASYVVHRRSGGWHPVLDERDRAISARAALHSLATSYVVFVLGIVGLQQYALRTGDCVPASPLMGIVGLAVALQALVRAASVIGQARSQEAEDRG